MTEPVKRDGASAGLVSMLAEALGHGDAAAASALVSSFVVPLVTELRDDLVGHDLAPDTLEFARGSFVPMTDQVILEVEAAYAVLGNARASLLLLIGQPERAGTTLYDAGGAPVGDARWYSMASVNGESAWASTTHRRVVVPVESGRPVTWQLLGAIIGGAQRSPVTRPARLAITPDGSRGFITSTTNGTVAPLRLGQPGYTLDSGLSVQDVVLDAIAVGGKPERLAADDTHVVVCDAGEPPRVLVLAAEDGTVVRETPFPVGIPTDCSLTPDGTAAVVTGSTGLLWHLPFGTKAPAATEVGSVLKGVAVTTDGRHAFAADPEQGLLHRFSLPELELQGTVDVGLGAHVVRTAPDGMIWVLCDVPDGAGLLRGIDPADDRVVASHTLPYDSPSDLAIVPVAGQSSEVVRSAWVVFDKARYCQFLIGGTFAGEVHGFHHGSLGIDDEERASVAVNGFGEIWVTQPTQDQVWRWPGGRIMCRADAARPDSGVFFGEYCTVSIYGARSPDFGVSP